MSKKIRQLFAFSLLLVFLTPTAVKLLDDAFHHHLYYAKQHGESSEWVTYHRTCPIPGFTLSIFSLEKQDRVIEKPKYGTRLFPFPPQQFSIFELNVSTLLRAPPASDNIL